MLNPKKKTEHVLFSDFLVPPEEFPNLECAIAATYSLDISALISCMVTLAFGDDIDSELFKNKVSILSSLETLSKKMVVFCDPGQIKASRSKNKEFALLLENIVFPVNLPKINGRYPSFHPKFWLLHFSNKHGESHYRFVVLSRNISFDKTYDISLVLEGDGLDESKEDDLKKTKKILDYIEYLKRVSPLTERHIGMIDTLIARMKKERVSFKIDNDIFDERNYDFIPVYHKKKVVDTFFEQLFHKRVKFNKILIISPFIKSDFLRRLKKKMTNEKQKNIKIITRESSLEEIDKKYLNEFEFYMINPGVIEATPSGDDSVDVDENERMGDGLYDIHAKMFLLESNHKNELIIGSANATNAAISLNHEFVVRLCSKSNRLCVNNFFNELNTEKKNFLVPISLASLQKESASIQKDVEDIVRSLSHVESEGVVEKVGDKYKVILRFKGMPDIGDAKAYIKMLPLDEQKELLPIIHFEDLNAWDISEFFYISVGKGIGDDMVKMERIIKIPLRGVPNNIRKQRLINDVINNSELLSEYILLVLSNNPILTQVKNKGAKDKSSGWNNISNQTSLYETLLYASVFNPQAILNLEDNIKLIEDKNVISDDLRYLYRQFIIALDKEGIRE